MSIDQVKVEPFMGQLVGDVGATVSSALAHLGHRLALYRAMAGAEGPTACSHSGTVGIPLTDR